MGNDLHELSRAQKQLAAHRVVTCLLRASTLDISVQRGFEVARSVPSLQHIARTREHARFVGRQAQTAQFRRNLELPPDHPERRFVFSIHGDAGVGKTYLVRHLRRLADTEGLATARVDETSRDILAVMGRIAAELAHVNSPLRVFEKRHAYYEERRNELESDPQAPEGAPTFLTRTAVGIGLGAAKGIPIAGGFIQQVDPAALAEQAERIRKYLSKRMRSNDVRLLMSPVDELSPLFVQGLAEVAQDRQLALFFDSYEQSRNLVENWLLDLFDGKYGDLTSALTVTIAGQHSLDLARWSPYLDLIEEFSLVPFTETEARQLLVRSGVDDESLLSVIIALTGRLPLLLAMLAQNKPLNLRDIGDPTGSAVDRFLKWEQDPDRRALAKAAALPRSLDMDALRVITGETDVEGSYDWLGQQPFVTDDSGRFVFHAIVRTSMLRVLRRESPQDWRTRHRALAAWHRETREDLGLTEQAAWTDTVCGRHLIEEVYHCLCADPSVTLPRALGLAVHAIRAGDTTAQLWAEMIEQAGADADFAKGQEWGQQLQAALAESGSHGAEYLTLLIRRGDLEQTARTAALVARAGTYQLMRRFEAAIADFNEALALNPKLSWTLAVRGETYRLMKQHSHALRDLNQAVELDPDLAWAISSRGILYRELVRYDDALADFNRALSIDPGYAWAIAGRGETYRLMGRHSAALADFDHAIDLDPDYAWAIASRGRVRLNREDFQGAVTDFDRALSLDSALDWVLLLRARTHRKRRRYADALADFDRLVRKHPDNAEYLGRRGRILLAMSSLREAQADFDHAVDLVPSLDWAIAGQGEVQLRLGNHAEAVAYFDQALAIDGTNEWVAQLRQEASDLERGSS
ncbi:tetratricopeptide repeat protein [Streptomyces sp. NPDC001002]